MARWTCGPSSPTDFLSTNAAKAYEIMTGKAREPFLGVLFVYPDNPTVDQKGKPEYFAGPDR
jgi:hypothetical protein